MARRGMHRVSGVGKTPAPGGPRLLRRERFAVSVVFLITGATFGTWAARIPAVQGLRDLSAGQLGVAFVGLMAGAFVGLPLAGVLAARFGSRKVLAASLLSFVAGLALIPLAPTLGVLTGVVSVFGAANSGVDVAINTQGTHVERGYARPILSGMHAMFSTGALAAAAAAALAARHGVPVGVHFAATAGLLAPMGLAAISAMTDEQRAAAEDATLALPARALAVPSLIAFCMVFAEDVANTWSAVYLRTVTGAGADLAAAGFAVYSAGMLGGRLLADRLVAAVGAARTISAGAAMATVGLVLAIIVPSPPAATIGLLLLGAGLAPALPVLYSEVARRDPSRAGPAIAAITTVGYSASVIGPGSVGAIAEPLGLRAALILVPVLTAAMIVLARRLQPTATR